MSQPNKRSLLQQGAEIGSLLVGLLDQRIDTDLLSGKYKMRKTLRERVTLCEIE